jgi:hypothetical protein
MRGMTEEVHHDTPVSRIESSCGFVGQHDVRKADERACDCHALLLPGAEIARQGVARVAESEALEQAMSLPARRCNGAAAQPKDQLDVLDGAQRRKQIEALKHEADSAAADTREIPFAETDDVLIEYRDGSRRGVQDASHDAQKRCLAAAGRSREDHHLAGRDLEFLKLPRPDAQGNQLEEPTKQPVAQRRSLL